MQRVVAVLTLPEERSSQLLRGGTLKLRKFLLAKRHKYHTPTFLVRTTQWRLTNNFLLPELTAWRPFRAQNIRTSDLTQVFSGKLGARWEFLLLSTVFGGGGSFSENFFPPKNLIYIFWRENISYSHFLSLDFTAAPSSELRRRHCRIRYQVSLPLLLPTDPGTRWIRPAGPSSYLVERIFWWIMKSSNFNRKFLPAVGLELLKLGLLGCRLIH